MQVAAGIVCVVFGLLHFADRGRPNDTRRSYFFGAPGSPSGRGVLALLEIAVGFVLLFS